MTLFCCIVKYLIICTGWVGPAWLYINIVVLSRRAGWNYLAVLQSLAIILIGIACNCNTILIFNHIGCAFRAFQTLETDWIEVTSIYAFNATAKRWTIICSIGASVTAFATWIRIRSCWAGLAFSRLIVKVSSWADNGLAFQSGLIIKWTIWAFLTLASSIIKSIAGITKASLTFTWNLVVRITVWTSWAITWISFTSLVNNAHANTLIKMLSYWTVLAKPCLIIK